MNQVVRLVGEPVRVPPPVDWQRLREQLGLRLPGDYMELCRRYPPLRIDNFMGTFHPVEDSEGENLVSWAEDILGAAEDLNEEFPDLGLVPFSLYPAEGGLFPWGVTDNSDHLFWRTKGDPDTWTIVVAGHSYAEGEWWEFDGSMTDFIVGIMNREVICPVLASEFPSVDAKIVQVPLP
ncbi:SMI1/KNR4 family protein [Actinomadura sp. 1N219]|uniref:SMI1/KNR4 family protein n=1 Tax=Actinomadura sp. 1N219 TaxID=3375152 RepID=UPI0037A8EE61